MESIINNMNQDSQDAYTLVSQLTVDKLEQLILYTADKYYNHIPVITDGIYDILVDFLRLKNKKSAILKKIGAPFNSKDKVELPFYLGSMDKIKPPSPKLQTWINEYSAPYIIGDKLDGISGLLVYSQNKIKLYTRGTATHGIDISFLLSYLDVPTYETILSVFPKILKNNQYVAFRGELVISKNKFDKNWANTMKNSRNAVGGLVHSKTLNPLLAHDTDFVVYQLVEPNYNYSKQLEFIKKLEFKIVHTKITDNLTFEMLSAYLLKRRTMSKYIIDGIIVTNDKVHPINTKGNPDHAFAFKDVLEDQKSLTAVEMIEWNESKDGYLIPTIIISPINIGGVTIKRVTGNNAKFIVDNMIGVGSKVEVIRSNDVIPKIEKVITKVQPILPKGTNWMWSDSGVHIISTDKDSTDMKIKSLYHFFSTLETVGLGEKNIEKLYNANYNTIEKILKLTKDNIINIDGFKEKSADNIIKAIKKATTNIPIAKLLVASNKLGHGIGIERAKNLTLKYSDILNNKKYEKLSDIVFINMIKEIDGFDDNCSSMFVSNYNDIVIFYNSIKTFITIETAVIKASGNKYNGKKIVISGFRDKELEKYILDEGGILANTISKNTDILVIKDKSVSDTSKVIKAKELGIKIYTLDEFNKNNHYNL